MREQSDLVLRLEQYCTAPDCCSQLIERFFTLNEDMIENFVHHGPQADSGHNSSRLVSHLSSC